MQPCLHLQINRVDGQHEARWPEGSWASLLPPHSSSGLLCHENSGWGNPTENSCRTAPAPSRFWFCSVCASVREDVLPNASLILLSMSAHEVRCSCQRTYHSLDQSPLTWASLFSSKVWEGIFFLKCSNFPHSLSLDFEQTFHSSSTWVKAWQLCCPLSTLQLDLRLGAGFNKDVYKQSMAH